MTHMGVGTDKHVSERLGALAVPARAKVEHEQHGNEHEHERANTMTARVRVAGNPVVWQTTGPRFSPAKSALEGSEVEKHEADPLPESMTGPGPSRGVKSEPEEPPTCPRLGEGGIGECRTALSVPAPPGSRWHTGEFLSPT